MLYLDMGAMLSWPKTNMLLIAGFLFWRHSTQLSHLVLAMIRLLILPIMPLFLGMVLTNNIVAWRMRYPLCLIWSWKICRLLSSLCSKRFHTSSLRKSWKYSIFTTCLHWSETLATQANCFYMAYLWNCHHPLWLNIQSTLSKTDTLRTGTKCPS